MTEKTYDVIIVDPPWHCGSAAREKRLCMKSIDEIQALPVPTLSKKRAFLFLWCSPGRDRATHTPIIQAGMDLIQHWGFSYYTLLTWHKRNQVAPFGPFNMESEYCLAAYKGHVRFETSRFGKLPTVITSENTDDGSKPDFFYDCVRAGFGGERCEIFGKKQRQGFDIFPAPK